MNGFMSFRKASNTIDSLSNKIIKSPSKRNYLQGKLELCSHNYVTYSAVDLLDENWNSKPFELKICERYQTDSLLAGELKMMGTLQGCKNIMDLVEHWVAGDLSFVVRPKPVRSLFDQLKIIVNSPFPERDAVVRDYAYQILKAVGFCHQHNIIHRNVGLNVCVIVDNMVKLTDFSFATDLSHSPIIPITKDLYYGPPEDAYGPAWDMWCVGIVIFMLLSGFHPFAGATVDEIRASILIGRLRFPVTHWASIGVSCAAQELLWSLLAIDPAARLTAAHALKHSWFTTNVIGTGVRRYWLYNLLYPPLNGRFLAIKHCSSGFYDLRTYGQNTPEYIWISTEIEILKCLEGNHENIFAYTDFWVVQEYITVVLPQIACTLQDHLAHLRTTNKSVAERESVAKDYVYQLLDAVYHCHRHGVVHGNITPKNVIFLRDHDERILKLCGFRTATKDIAGGTPAGYRNDLHAVGVITFRLITDQLFFHMLNGSVVYTFPYEIWEKRFGMSFEARQFMQMLLTSHDLTAYQALFLPWLNSKFIHKRRMVRPVVSPPSSQADSATHSTVQRKDGESAFNMSMFESILNSPSCGATTRSDSIQSRQNVVVDETGADEYGIGIDALLQDFDDDDISFLNTTTTTTTTAMNTAGNSATANSATANSATANGTAAEEGAHIARARGAPMKRSTARRVTSKTASSSNATTPVAHTLKKQASVDMVELLDHALDNTDYISPTLSALYRSSVRNPNESIGDRSVGSVSFYHRHKPKHRDEFAQKYVLLHKVLGKGMFGRVYLAHATADNTAYAVKLISRTALNNTSDDDRRNEVRIMQLLTHEYIVKIYDFYEDDPSYYRIVMEYVRGGPLLDHIVHKETYNEKEARDVAAQLLTAIAFCHEKGVIHRDIKPENLLVGDNDMLKIADFGLAVQVSEAEGWPIVFCGTKMFKAPEVTGRTQYDFAVDMWSIGVVLFILLGGYHPFYSKDKTQFALNIQRGCVFDPLYWASKSNEVKHLINGLLTLDCKARLTAQQAMEHSWLSASDAELQTNEIDTKVLRKYLLKVKFRAAAKAVAAVHRFKTIHNLVREEEQATPYTFHDRYTPTGGRPISRSSFGYIFTTAKQSCIHRLFSVDVIPRNSCNGNNNGCNGNNSGVEDSCVFEYVNILRQLNHCSIVYMNDFFQSESEFHIVTEYLCGGRLFDRVIKKKVYT